MNHLNTSAGLDPDHMEYANTQQRRHEMETYYNAEGAADLAEQNAHAMDDGVIESVDTIDRIAHTLTSEL